MQRDIGESTSRTQTPTLPEPAVVGTRPLHLPPVFHHPYHHSPSTNFQGWAWCGETQYPPPYPPFIVLKQTEIQRRESEENNGKPRWRRTRCSTCLLTSWDSYKGKYSEDWDWEEENKECGSLLLYLALIVNFLSFSFYLASFQSQPSLR